MLSEILCVGTELLLGQVVNTDAQFISRKLSELGIGLHYIQTVGDNPGRVKDAVKLALSRADLLITTGGLGPTDDDLTKETVAECLGLAMETDAAALKHLEEQFAAWGRPMAENNRKQADFPVGAHILKNDKGTAPGCAMEVNGKIVIVLPGPPYELVPMLENEVVPYLADKLNYRIESRFIRTIGIGESDLEMTLKDMIRAQDKVTIATYCEIGESQVRITVMCGRDEDPACYLDPVEDEIRRRLGDKVYAIGETNMAEVAAKLLIARKATVATAESCTGGMIAEKLVSVPGVSSVFGEGYVTYANEAKEKLLGVSHETLERFGAVSEETAREMAEGLKIKSGADYCLSVTGIAGPDGGTKEKPVGLVYIGIAAPSGTTIEKHQFRGDRAKVRAQATLRALDLLRRSVLAN